LDAIHVTIKAGPNCQCSSAIFRDCNLSVFSVLHGIGQRGGHFPLRYRDVAYDERTESQEEGEEGGCERFPHIEGQTKISGAAANFDCWPSFERQRSYLVEKVSA
jgi:hypothetical protein